MLNTFLNVPKSNAEEITGLVQAMSVPSQSQQCMLNEHAHNNLHVPSNKSERSHETQTSKGPLISIIVCQCS